MDTELGAGVRVTMPGPVWFQPGSGEPQEMLAEPEPGLSIVLPFTCFLLISICVKYLFPALHFQSVCVPCFEVGLLLMAYIGVLFLYPFSQSLSFDWGIQPIYI